MDTEQKISEFIVNKFLEGDRQNLTTTTSLFELGIINSFSMVELIQFLEQTFSIHVEDHEYIPDYFLSIARMTKFIESKKKIVYNN